MKQRIVLFWLMMISVQIVYAQHTFKTIVTGKKSGAPLKNVTIIISPAGEAITNDKGYAEIQNIPAGKFLITWSHVGFTTLADSIRMPLPGGLPLQVSLEEVGEDLEEVVVQSMRTGRTIANTPTRVETIDGEELDEKNNMRPANVSMLLHESTGIQVQQTSATSGNSSIRIQGLDGRYTQLLKDGYANFGNFASGLSILEIPPLDLRQVEVIKGPASTLYGGGAIAGVVNFISKMPEPELEGDFIINQSHIGQTNLGAYLSQRGRKTGYAVLGQLNFQKPYDVDKDDFSELPKSNNFTISPRLFFYPNESATVILGNSLTAGKNTGGDMHVIKGNAGAGHVYFEENKTLRNTSTLELNKAFAGRNSLKLKQSLTFFNRRIEIPSYTFSGKNINAFTDLSYLFFLPEHTMIGGANFVYDQFKQDGTNTLSDRSATAGVYFQDTWDVTDVIKLETGIRTDYVKYRNINFAKNETFVLPRISALFKVSDKISSRIGGGLGYKIPTAFNERTESMQYQHIRSLNNVKAERSIGGTADINYKTKVGGDFSLSFNQMFFYTAINRPLVLEQAEGAEYFFLNAAKPVSSKGFETNLKLVFKKNLKLFAGYTFTDARAAYLQQNQVVPLMPRHRLNAVMMYEKENNFKLGLEGYHTGTQYLYNGYKTPSFWEFGFMAQKTFNRITVFINFENFTDERQSRYKGVANPPFDNPSFDDIWNHTEGRIINGGIKIRW